MVKHYKTKPEADYNPPVEEVISTIKHGYRCRFTDSVDGESDCDETLVTISDTDNWEEMPDLTIVARPTPFLTTTKLTDDGTHYVEIDQYGKFTFTTPNNCTKYTHEYKLEITDLDSLRTITVSAPSRDASNAVEVDIYIDGTISMQISVWKDSPAFIDRQIFKSASALSIQPKYYTDKVPINAGYDFIEDLNDVYIALDYINGAEKLIAPLLTGAIAGSLSQAGVDVMQKYLGNDSTIKSLAAQAGITVGQIITTYAAMLGYAVSKGWRSWDDFSLQGIVDGLINFKGLASLGMIAGTSVLTTVLGKSKASTMAGLLSRGGAGFFIASSYLTVMASINRWVFPEGTN
jgi:hypothetical protein